MKQSVEKLWTIEDVAEFCQVKPSVVKYWVRNREIPHIRLGRQIRFQRVAIADWLESGERQPFFPRRERLRGI